MQKQHGARGGHHAQSSAEQSRETDRRERWKTFSDEPLEADRVHRCEEEPWAARKSGAAWLLIFVPERKGDGEERRVAEDAGLRAMDHTPS